MRLKRGRLEKTIAQFFDVIRFPFVTLLDETTLSRRVADVVGNFVLWELPVLDLYVYRFTAQDIGHG